MKQLTALMTAAIAALVLVLGAPAQAQGIDVVFKIDESGSMGGEINDVKNNVITIFNALPPGSSVGVVGYGSSLHGPSGQLPHVHTPVTSDQPTLQTAVNELTAGGALEQGYRAVYESATDTVYNESLQFTEAPYCNILITDETPNQGGRTQQEAIDAMNAAGGIFFGILPSGLFTEAQPLADATGGQLFNLASFQNDATAVIEAVLAACVEAAVPIKADVKPQSCPNPFRLKNKGNIPVALLGSEDFDVNSIIPESVKLEGDCPALRWSIEDVATPYDGGFSEPPNENECTEYGADGYADLTLKFDSQCVASEQGVVTENDVRLWTITGDYVNDAGDVVEFSSEDVVRVMP
jgi:von Willebrand factor type A domain